jgi:hypothetical protein
MDQSIIQIDISILDKEIESLKAELQKKTALRDYIQSLAKKSSGSSFKTSTPTTAPVKTNTTQPVKSSTNTTSPSRTNTNTAAPAKTNTPVKKASPVKAATKKAAPAKAAATTPVPAKTASAATPSKNTAPSKAIGLTDFIVDYLKKNPKSENKAITESYMKTTGKKLEDIRFNLANTLSRLRRENKVKAQDGPKGRGFLWSLK